MKRLHIVGRQNHGKTQLIVELLPLLIERGIRVATIKHTHHRHELDAPGKDSHRHRTAGAVAVGIMSRDLDVVYLPRRVDGVDGDHYARLAPWFDPFDLVLVEGDHLAAAPKLEVWRAALGTEPMAAMDPSIGAVVTDDPLTVTQPVVSRRDLRAIADWILRQDPGPF